VFNPKRKVISIPDLADWYSIGWRVVGPDVHYGKCIIEWRSSKPPVAPYRAPAVAGMVEGRVA